MVSSSSRRLIPAACAALLLCLVSTASAIAQEIVAQFAPRVVRHAAGQIGASGNNAYMASINFAPGEEYYLDYTFTFRPGFDWEANGRPRGGKLPGLAGGSGTGGCRAKAADGWSARQTWGASGTVTLYLYDQNRDGRCGTKIAYVDGGKPFRFVTGRKYRLTQRVKVNAPGAANGEIQIWVDGRQVLLKRDLRLRGNVAASQGRVSQLKYHSYFGGDNQGFAPARDSYIDYGPMYVLKCMPNLNNAPGRCG